MPELAFVVSKGQSWIFRERVATLRHELELQGVPTAMYCDGFPEPVPERVYVLVAPQEYVAIEGHKALPDEAILKRTVFICAQRPSTIHHEDNIELLRQAGAVFDINARSVLLLHRWGIPARHLRLGYSEHLDHFDPTINRDLDIMFLGSHSLRRTKALAECARALSPYNCLLQIADASVPDTGGSSSFLAETKWDLLARAKVLVNVHGTEEFDLEWPRVLDAIHAGAVVITEHSSGLAPLVPGEHLVVASLQSMPSVIEAVLGDPERLSRLRTDAYERIRAWLPLSLSVAVLRAAAMDILGRPVPSGASLGRTSEDGHAPSDRWMPTPPDGDRDALAMRRDLRDVSLELADIRNQIGLIEQLVRSESGAAPSSPAHDTSLVWSRIRHPLVTVVVTLGHQAHLIDRTLDSLTRGSMSDFELVIVGEGSTDESRDGAREWIHAHPWIAARLLEGEPYPRIGGALNAGVELARAPYCLTLKPGDELYPRCLDVLFGTLQAMPDVPIAYPMLEATGPVDAFVVAGGDYLLSCFGWEPGRLRIRNFIDGFALIRTDRLRELGGFATTRRLRGWEHYDLWCRAAEKGWRGQLVPQILGRRRGEPDEILTTTDQAAAAAVAALVERAPRVMAGVLRAA